MEEISTKLDYFKKIQAFAIFCILLQSAKYMYFSKRMSLFLDVFSKAKFELIFFVFFFGIVLIDFALVGYFFFGAEIDDFSSLSKSIIKCLIMLIGNVDLQELMNSNEVIGPLFYVCFMVLIIFVSLNFL